MAQWQVWTCQYGWLDVGPELAAFLVCNDFIGACTRRPRLVRLT